MDNTDGEILKRLKANSRMTASAIAAEVNMSVSSVSERIKKLEDSGIIKKYTICLEPVGINKRLYAYFGVTLAAQAFFDGFCAEMERNDAVLTCDMVSADFDFLLRVQVSDTDSLSALREVIGKSDGVIAVKTFVVLKNVKDDFSALPDEAGIS